LAAPANPPASAAFRAATVNQSRVTETARAPSRLRDGNGRAADLRHGRGVGSGRWGEIAAASGRAAIQSIETGARLALAGTLDAIAPAPINKEALRLAGSPFPGHTEMLRRSRARPKY